MNSDNRLFGSAAGIQGALAALILILSCTATTYGQQNTFQISGQTSICPDNTTTYTYYGIIDNLDWSVSGGEFVGSHTGVGSVTVKWFNANGGSLGATGTEGSCWLDTEQSPPVYYCDYTTWTSSPFSVSSTIITPYILNASIYCAGGSTNLTLAGSQTGVTYQLNVNGSPIGSPVSGTGNPLTWSNQTATGTYSVAATKSSPSCSFTFPATPIVNAQPLPTAYLVGGGGNYCTGGAGLSVTLSNSEPGNSQTGVLYQLKVNGANAGTAVTGTGSSLTWINQTAAGAYTIVATNAITGCQRTMTGSVNIIVDPTTVGGALSYVSIACAPASGTLNLTGNTGNVVRWEYQASGWNTIEHTSTAYPYSNVTISTNFRAVVKSGACAENYSSQSMVSVDAPSSPGTLTSSNDVYASTAAGTLTIGASTGDIARWEKNTGGPDWSPIVSGAQNYSYNISQSTSYRVVVKNGVCPEANSNQVNINLYTPPAVTPSSPPSIAYGKTTLLSANNGYYQYKWFKNGTEISGATAQQYTAVEPAIYHVQVKANSASLPGNSSPVEVTSVALGYRGTLNAVSTTMVLQEGIAETASLYALDTNNLAQSIAYADGLGRTFQTVAVGQSPAGGDLVSHNAASRYGVVDSTFLPYATSSRNGSYRQNAIRGSSAYDSYSSSEQYLFYQNAAKVAHDTYPYARAAYTNDPTLWVTEQGAPGQDWQTGSTHTVRSEMALNNATTYRVRYWNTAGLTSANYPDNTVVVSITTDENGNKVRSYTDPRGLPVLKQVQMDETLEGVSAPWLETYYIYDELGRIKYILPPKAMKVLGTGTPLDANHASITEHIHKFTYDARGRLVEKKVPGAIVQFIVYDKLDRVVLVQDGNLRATNRWMFVKYDIDNRVVYSGIYRNTTQTTRTAVQGILDGITYALPATPWYEVKQSGTPHGYSNNVFPTTGTQANEILSVNYFDHYDFDQDGADDFAFDGNHFPGQETARSQATRGLATGSKRVVLDAAGVVTTYWIKSAVFYDKLDRPLQTQTNNHLHTSFTAATLDKTTVIYDFVKVLKTKSTHYQNASTSVALEDWNDYDHAGRVLKAYRKINGGSQQLLAQYEYNALGQVVDKKLHGDGSGNFLQSIDYRYNIRGWLKSINNAQLTVDGSNDELGDYFGMELVYNTTESGMSNTSYYNGNISAMKWKGPGTSGAADQRSYKYTYDKSDRLKTATFQASTGTAWTREAGTLDESMTYDHNGNIKTLLRKRNLRGNSGITITATPETIDNLTYTYANHRDRLTKVDDAATVAAGFINGSTAGTEYTYNTDGSMLRDLNKGITTDITYNFLGKPQVVNFTSGKKIEYIYDAAGTKLTMKTYQNTTLLSCTNYAGSFVYEGATPALSFFGSPEGRVVKNGSNFEYQYAIADHQGNTRVVFSSATPTPEAVTANMEAASNSGFQNYTNRVNFDLFDHTDAGTTYTYSQKLTGAASSQVGVAKSYKVYAGDKVKIEARAKYTLPSGTASNIAGFAAALFNAFGVEAPAGGEVGTPSAALNTWGGLVVAGDGGESSGPLAFVNIIVFDKNYKFLDANWEAIDPGAYQDGATPVVDHDYMMREYTVKEEGYVFMFVSNENPTLVDVHFDDVVMTYTKGNVVQYNEYYPFGMQTANSWTRENTLGNNFLANSGTELNTTSSLYDLDYRNYDPVLGRMNQIDPLAAKYASLTPYNFSFNDPVTFTDPSGASPLDNLESLIRRLWNEVPIDGGGAGWSEGGGFTGGYGNEVAAYIGSDYNTQFGSWSHTAHTSYGAFVSAYHNATGTLLLNSVTITAGNGTYDGEPYTNPNWLNSRIDWAQDILSHSFKFWQTMSNPLVREIHQGQTDFVENPWGGGLMAFLTGGPMIGVSSSLLTSVGGSALMSAGSRIATQMLTNLTTTGLRAAAINASVQALIKGPGNIDLADVGIAALGGDAWKTVGVLSGLIDVSIDGKVKTAFDKGIYQTTVDVGTGVFFGGANFAGSKYWLRIPPNSVGGVAVDATIQLYGEIFNWTLSQKP